MSITPLIHTILYILCKSSFLLILTRTKNCYFCKMSSEFIAKCVTGKVPPMMNELILLALTQFYPPAPVMILDPSYLSTVASFYQTHFVGDWASASIHSIHVLATRGRLMGPEVSQYLGQALLLMMAYNFGPQAVAIATGYGFDFGVNLLLFINRRNGQAGWDSYHAWYAILPRISFLRDSMFYEAVKDLLLVYMAFHVPVLAVLKAGNIPVDKNISAKHGFVVLIAFLSVCGGMVAHLTAWSFILYKSRSVSGLARLTCEFLLAAVAFLGPFKHSRGTFFIENACVLMGLSFYLKAAYMVFQSKGNVSAGMLHFRNQYLQHLMSLFQV